MRSKLMWKLVFAIFLAGCIAFNPVFSGSVGAEEVKGKATEKAQKTRGEGTDENIKSKFVANDPKAEIPAPPNKGGAMTRANWCTLHVDNHTSWIISIYVNGQGVGDVSRWGDAEGEYEFPVTLYAVASFDNGSKLTFGPRIADCVGHRFTWTLTP